MQSDKNAPTMADVAREAGVALGTVSKVVNGQPVAKISDDPSKSICKDSKYVDYLKRCINWRMTHLYYDSEKF